jgi:site-specific DNA-methyltransferase (adenine-specific)
MKSLKINEIYQGDAIEILKQFPSESISCCITDPPYNYEFIGHKWDDEEVKRRIDRVQNSKTMVKNIPYGSGLAGGVRNERWYLKNRQNTLEYIKWCESWGEGLFKACKTGAPVAVFNSNRSIAHVQIALENVGFYTRDIIVYKRNSGIPKGLNLEKKLEKLGRTDSNKWKGWHSAFRNEWEAILIVQKPLMNNYIETLDKSGVGVFKVVNEDGSFQSNVFEDSYKKNKKEETFEHCTVKPIALIRRLIDILVPPGEKNIILDPFAGSGTTLVAAKEMNYNFIGIEIEPNYIPIIKSRLSEKTAPMPKPHVPPTTKAKASVQLKML